MSEKARVMGYYKKLSKTYDKKRLSSEKNKLLSKFQNEWFVKNLENTEASTCLEIGCGTGRLTAELLRKTDVLVATDTSPEMIALNKRRISSSKPKNEFHYVVCDATYLPFNSGSFNNVACARVFWHINDYPRVLKESLFVLASGGSLLFDFPCLWGPFSMYSKLRRVNPEVLTLFIAKSTIKQMFKKTKKLTIEGNTSFFLFFMPNKLLKIETIKTIIHSLERANNFFLKNVLCSYYLIKFTK